MITWQPMGDEPQDSRFRLYGLWVNGKNGTVWFEVHYLCALMDDPDASNGEMQTADGAEFVDWSYHDFEFWADLPPLPLPGRPKEQKL